MENSITNQPMQIPLEFCDYSDKQLLDVIEHLISGMRTVANALESSRPDITTVLDSIIDFDGIVELDEVKDCHDTAMIGDTNLVILDRKNHKFLLTDLDGKVIEETPAITLASAAKKMEKKAARAMSRRTR